jgi:hypothetical protein
MAPLDHSRSGARTFNDDRLDSPAFCPGGAVTKRKIEMFQYGQTLVRLRLGDSDREIARSRTMWRKKVAEIREIANARGWLAPPPAALPDDAAVVAALMRKESARPRPRTITYPRRTTMATVYPALASLTTCANRSGLTRPSNGNSAVSIATCRKTVATKPYRQNTGTIGPRHTRSCRITSGRTATPAAKSSPVITPTITAFLSYWRSKRNMDG